MHKTLSIHQPNYFPWLGYFYKIAQSDIFIFLDDVQFSNEGMQNYHYIKTPNGIYRLKIPIMGKFGTIINKIKTRDELGWKEKHLRTIQMNYKKAPFFNEVYADIKALITPEYESLSDLDVAIIRHICNKFEIKTEMSNSSPLELTSKRENKVLDICNSFNVTNYLSGTGARNYQDEENFNQHGIKLKYSSFKPFVYNQLWGEFESNVSVIDYLMNCGYDWDLVIQNQKNE